MDENCKKRVDSRLDRSTPEEQGVRSQDISDFIDTLQSNNLNVHSFMIIRHDKVIAEAWWKPYTSENKRYVYSLSKSFTSTAIGFAVAEGYININDKVLTFFRNELPDEVDENLESMTIKDLLSMSTGHAVDTFMAILDPDEVNWTQIILSLPVYYKPGTQFLYNTGASYLLSVILQRVTGISLLEFLKPRLFDPLNITDITWDMSPEGYNCGGWGLSIKPEDIAKFGLLYLHNGVWNGQRLLPKEWIKEATSPVVRNDTPEREAEPIDWKQGYGYQFWCCRHNAYRADGAFGQFCIVMPEQDVVIVMTSETNNDQGILDAVWNNLLPSMKNNVLPNNPAGRELLNNKIRALQLFSPKKPHSNNIVERISGKKIVLEDNPFGLQSIIFDFNKDSCQVSFHSDMREYSVICGTEDILVNDAEMPGIYMTGSDFLFKNLRNKQFKVAAAVQWLEENIFALKWQFVETAHSETVICKFGEDSLRMEFLSSFARPDGEVFKVDERIYKGRLS